MLLQRLAAWIALCCFATTVALPGFAAAVPQDDGTISIVICSPDGFKTIEIAEESDRQDTQNHPRCDVCKIHCGLGAVTQVRGWTFPQSGQSTKMDRPSDVKVASPLAVEPQLPRGPPEAKPLFSAQH